MIKHSKSKVTKSGLIYVSDPTDRYVIGAMRHTMKGAKTVSVAVALCSESDEFSRKKGKKLVYERILNGTKIELPLGYLNNDELVSWLWDFAEAFMYY